MRSVLQPGPQRRRASSLLEGRHAELLGWSLLGGVFSCSAPAAGTLLLLPFQVEGQAPAGWLTQRNEEDLPFAREEYKISLSMWIHNVWSFVELPAAVSDLLLSRGLRLDEC